eukprot:8022832-Pyramimonas_sp.AAC.1
MDWVPKGAHLRSLDLVEELTKVTTPLHGVSAGRCKTHKCATSERQRSRGEPAQAHAFPTASTRCKSCRIACQPFA